MRNGTSLDPELKLSSKNIVWEDDLKVTQQGQEPVMVSVPKLIAMVMERNEFILKCLVYNSVCLLMFIVIFIVWLLRS